MLRCFHWIGLLYLFNRLVIAVREEHASCFHSIVKVSYDDILSLTRYTCESFYLIVRKAVFPHDMDEHVAGIRDLTGEPLEAIIRQLAHSCYTAFDGKVYAILTHALLGTSCYTIIAFCCAPAYN